HDASSFATAPPVTSSAAFSATDNGGDNGSAPNAPDTDGSAFASGGDIGITVDLSPLGGIGVDLGLDHGLSLDVSLLGISLDLDVPLALPQLLGPVIGTADGLVTAATDLIGPVLGAVDGLVEPILST